jgi:hypothetical protein
MQRGCRAEPQLKDDNEHNLFAFDCGKSPFCGPTMQFLLSQIATKAFAVKILGAFGQLAVSLQSCSPAFHGQACEDAVGALENAAATTTGFDRHHPVAKPAESRARGSVEHNARLSLPASGRFDLQELAA